MYHAGILIPVSMGPTIACRLAKLYGFLAEDAAMTETHYEFRKEGPPTKEEEGDFETVHMYNGVQLILRTKYGYN